MCFNKIIDDLRKLGGFITLVAAFHLITCIVKLRQVKMIRNVKIDYSLNPDIGYIIHKMFDYVDFCRPITWKIIMKILIFSIWQLSSKWLWHINLFYCCLPLYNYNK